MARLTDRQQFCKSHLDGAATEGVTVGEHARRHDRPAHALKEGAVVDASIIAAPSATRERKKRRFRDAPDERVHRMALRVKLDIGTDDLPGLLHNWAATPVNVSDLTPSNKLLHGEEQRSLAMVPGEAWSPRRYVVLGQSSARDSTPTFCALADGSTQGLQEV